MRKRGAQFLAASLAAVLALLLPAGIANAGDKTTAAVYAPDTWLRIETDHFIIYSNRTPDETYREVAALEQFRFFMEKLLPPGERSQSATEEKLQLFLLKSQSELDIVRPGFGGYVAGVYFFCEEGQSAFSAHIPLDADAAKVFHSQDQSQLVVFHEYTHYLMARKGLNQFPMWYVEGLADYYSTLEYDGTHFAVGAIPYDNNLLLNRFSWSGFETVLAPDKKYSSGLAVRGMANFALFYARAWLLTHYMMSDPTRRAQLEDYFERLRRGEASPAAFQAATGISPTELASVLRAYSKAMTMHIEDAGEVPQVSGDVDGLEDSYGSFVYQEAVLGSCPSQKHGAALLDNIKLQSDPLRLKKLVDDAKPGPQRDADQFALDLAPKVQAEPEYAMAVAYGEILYGDPAAPRAGLTAIGKDDPRYARAQYLLGRSYLKAAEKAEPDAKAALLAQAEPYLRIALAAMPDNGPAHYFLARSLDGSADHEAEALDLASKASSLIPSVFEYGSYAAILELRAGHRDEALAILDQYDNDPHDFKRNKLVDDAMAAIKAGKSPEDLQTLLTPPKDKDDDN